jgi:hypothetical protein
MVIRIRLRTRHSFADLRLQIALALAAVFAPAAMAALTLCFWSFGAELGLVSSFYVTAGTFSHWQVWFFAAALLLAGARLLTSYSGAHLETTSPANPKFHNSKPQFAEK